MGAGASVEIPISPDLVDKYKTNLRRVFDAAQVSKIESATLNYEELLNMPADNFLTLFVKD